MSNDLSTQQQGQSATAVCTYDDPGMAVPVSPWSGLAHDLRNLLQTASSAINIIDRSAHARSPHVRRAIAGARTSLTTASELLTRILDVPRTASAAARITDVEECLEEIAVIAATGMDAGIELVFMLDGELLPAQCDKTDLRNAVLNLILNARKAIIVSGRIALRASHVTTEAGEPAIEISVADNGVGMSAETARRAFEPYFTTRTEGLGGIGLYMVARFARQSGGRVWIESQPGAGTVVRMRLPAAPAEVIEEEGFAL